MIDGLTLPEVDAIYEYWRDYPPENEVIAIQAGYGRQLTMEEKIAQGAAGPADLLARARASKNGKFVHKLGGSKGKPN